MQPRLVYDGDCGFCRYTVDYARAITGDTVEYRSFQDVARDHGEVIEAQFRSSIQLFTDAGRSHGARAAFETLALGGRRVWISLYRGIPGLAAVFELFYKLVSAHREISHFIAKALFGKQLRPRSYEHTADWMYRGIALCGVAAFCSFWWQAHALIGADGILPVSRYLESVAAGYSAERFWLLPTLFWLNQSDLMLHLVCGIGALATTIGVFGRLRFSMAVVAYVCYLSLFHAGQTFMSFQWDILLAECFVLAAILARAPTLGIWVGRLLLFRFMFLSGAVKLLSGDPTWTDATALQYHFETQPLPTVLAWYAHQLPAVLLEWGVKLTFVIELVLPFFVFLPRNFRRLAFGAFVLLELLIFLTGSYNFFNILTVVLCISLLDDSLKSPLRGIVRSNARRWGATIFSALVMVQGLVILGTTLLRAPEPLVMRIASPFLFANRYGLFAVMTTHRDELVVEGSMDGDLWSAYGFTFKPGPVDRAPVWATPHQPRLDWQMWFAALARPETTPWIYDFVFALLESRPDVLSLVGDPFEGERPRFVRIQRYRYRFTETLAGESASDDIWWERELVGEWLAPAQLRKPKITHGPLIIE